MAAFDDVTLVTDQLAGVQRGERHGSATWNVGDRTFAWARPFSKADVKRFAGAPVPPGPILAVSVADLEDKQAVLSEGRAGVFTIPHFDGYPAVLIEMDVVSLDDLRDLLVDAWMTRASRQAVDDYRAQHPFD